MPNLQQPQSAVISSAESTSSISPSNESLGPEDSLGGRGVPGHADENAVNLVNPAVPRFEYHHQSHYSDEGPGTQKRATHAPISTARFGGNGSIH